MDKRDNTLPAELLGQIVAHAPFGVLVLEEGGRVAWSNPALCAMLDIELTGRTLHEAAEPHLQALIGPEHPVHVPGAPGRPERWLEGERHVLGRYAVWFYSDVSARVVLDTRLEATSTVDPVTGLLNRRGLQQALAPQVSRSRRYHNPLSVVILRLGMPELGPFGDEVLLAISRLLRDQLRWADVVGRQDSNEFLLILPETPLAAARALAEKIRGRLAQLPLSPLAPRFAAAEWRKGDDPARLLKRARAELETLR